MISFIVPAHNEEAWISRCLAAIRAAMEQVNEPYEMVVADDASTDRTPLLAAQQQARVIRVAYKHISATRNAGAKAAGGMVFFFVDADTLISAPVIQSALRALHEGAIGGGSVPRFEGKLPWWWRTISPLFAVGARWLRQPGGSCLFSTRPGFEAIGGFSEAHYAAEDAVFVSALKRHGRFVVLKESVVTSGRNLRAHSFWNIARLLTRLAVHGPNGFRDRRGLDLWYQPSREKPEQ